MGGLGPVSLGVAFLAGLGSFFSPCILPLLPVYLAYLTGTGLETGTGLRRSGVAAGLLFVAGLSTTLVWLGALAGWFGQALAAFAPLVRVAGGLLLLTFGLQLLDVWHLPGRWAGLMPPVRGPLRGFVMGAGLAAGWSPCLGPVVGTLLVYATVEAGGLPGAALLGAYSLGLSLPFLVALVIAPRVIAPVQRVAAHARRWRAAGGVVLIVTGLLLLTGQFARLVRLLPVSR